jgi:hypothetical protein
VLRQPWGGAVHSAVRLMMRSLLLYENLFARSRRLVHTNLLTPNPKHGIFLDSCLHHCGGWGSYEIDGMVQGPAFQCVGSCEVGRLSLMHAPQLATRGLFLI